jgi:hypothetical protein
MISCNECKERLYPEDPTIKVGRYHLSTCEHYCNKPIYYREFKQSKSEIQPIFRPRPVDKEIDQLKARYIHIQNKLNAHLDKKKKQGLNIVG